MAYNVKKGPSYSLTVGLSGSLNVLGGLTLSSSLDFSNKSQYHIRSINSSLILSSSADSIIALSSNLYFPVQAPTVSGHIVATNSHLILSSGLGTLFMSGAIRTNEGIGINTNVGSNRIAMALGAGAINFSGSVTSGYTTTIGMDDTGFSISHNSAARDIQLKTNSAIRAIVNTSPALSLSGGLDVVTGASGFWTTNGWSKAIQSRSAHAIMFQKVTTPAALGIGASSGGMYFIRCGAEDASLPAVYDMILSNSKGEGNLAIGTGNNAAASARLDLGGTTGALLIPRLTNAQKDALTPTAGMIIYNTTSGSFQAYNTSWKTITIV